MSQRGQMLQAIGDDGIYYTWYKRPYTRRILQQRQQEGQSTSQEGEGSLNLEMLNPQQTRLSDLGENILARCFQCMPITGRFNMEHVSRLFLSAAKKSWLPQSHVVIVPEAVLNDGNYSIDGRQLFRLLMKRCARYTLELTIHAMAPQDRIFRLLNLAYRVENLCIDSLNPFCGSEIREIGERLPLLKTLIIRNCRIHFSLVRHFNAMLEQLQQLQVFAIADNINFRCELEQTPRNLRIFCLRDFQMTDNIGTLLRNVRQRAPNITVLSIESRNAEVVNQVQAFEHLNVLCILYSIVIAEDVVPADTFPVNYLNQLTALELGLVNEIFIVMRFLPEMFPRLEHFSFSIVENPRSELHKLLDPIVKFPVLRSFCFGIYQQVRSWEQEQINKVIDTYPLIFQKEYLTFVRKLFEQKKLEHLQLNFPLSTDMAIDVFKFCPNIRSFYFHNRRGHIARNIQDGDYFITTEFIRKFKKLKRNQIPPNKESKKIRMLGKLFKGTELEDGSQWILCHDDPMPSHVLVELFVKELGEEYKNTPTQLLFKYWK
uniref:F-box domain-containing protein n=1 Tax=Meloidogyne hapla TaxID=6305 RepID=A0A1I8AYU7_MELHA